MTERRERGAITAELALALPAVVALMAVVLAVGSAAAGQIAMVSGARAGARAAALGLSDAEVSAAAEAVAGVSASVSVSRADGLVRVHCSRSVPVPPFGFRTAQATVVAVCEPARGCG
ncbi:MAG: hypothetical protein LBG11_02390 [Bifidobacteriaceae bacterium]|jgi:Flp pilus assembly protein TadG|nr:hypothetical protein [Bifidobacteriaceae bacterium]